MKMIKKRKKQTNNEIKNNGFSPFENLQNTILWWSFVSLGENSSVSSRSEKKKII